MSDLSKEAARYRVKVAKSDLERAEKNLEDAQKYAHAHGMSYSVIAGWMGQTEAAVRLRFKRKGWNARKGSARQNPQK